LTAAGLAMIVPMFVPSRWRARGTGESEAAEAGEFISGLGDTAVAPVPAGAAEQPPHPSPTPPGGLSPPPAAPRSTASAQGRPPGSTASGEVSPPMAERR